MHHAVCSLVVPNSPVKIDKGLKMNGVVSVANGLLARLFFPARQEGHQFVEASLCTVGEAMKREGAVVVGPDDKPVPLVAMWVRPLVGGGEPVKKLVFYPGKQYEFAFDPEAPEPHLVMVRKA